MSTVKHARKVPACRGIMAVGATSPDSRHHTQDHAHLRADRSTFVFRPTPEQAYAAENRVIQEIARMRNETKVSGLIMPIGAEW